MGSERRILGIQRGDRIHLLLITALLVAVMVGLFVSGVGSWLWWFLCPLVALMPLGLYLAREHDNIAYPYHRPYRRQAQNLRSALFILGVCCSVALGWLVAHQHPLPILDLKVAALVTVLFSLVCIFATWAVLRLSLLSFPILFLGVTFLFTSSPLILYQTQGYDAFQYWRMVDVDSIFLGLPVVMLAFSSFLVGALAAPLPEHGQASRPVPGRLSNAHLEILRTIGFALYVLSILLIVVATLRGSALTLAYEGGYRDFADIRKTGGMSRLIVASITWFMPWSLLLLTATSRTRRMFVQTLGLAAPAILLMLLGGARAAPLAAMLLIVSGGHLLGFSVDWKRSLVVIGLVAVLLTTTMNLRTIPIREWTPQLAIMALTNQIENSRSYELSPFTALWVSNSTSYQTLAGTILFVPDQEPHRYGRDYAKAMGAAIPFGHVLFSKLGVELDEGEPSDWLKSRISPTSWAGLGYLQIAEAYLQFGAYGVAGLYFLLGVSITLLWRRMEQGPLDASFLALILLLMMALLIWVRNESISLTRPLIWGWLLIYLLPALLDMQRTRSTSRRSPNRGQGDIRQVHSQEVLDKA